ncbi:MAG: hypothetical protein IPG17_06750 [Sandaracinaceae bacterium]|nr:hypothetical protein [Sandaracinaceae bacterium]
MRLPTRHRQQDRRLGGWSATLATQQPFERHALRRQPAPVDACVSTVTSCSSSDNAGARVPA